MRKTQKTAVVGGTVAVLMAGGVAYAAWTSEGAGSATVKAGSQTALTVTGGSLVEGLFPTGHQDITVTVTNNNPYAVTLEGVKKGTITNDKSLSGCEVTDVTATDAATDTSRLAASGETGDSKEYTFTVSMGPDSDQGCQGATFTVPYTAKGHSSN